jgi:parallel beta-helix repeat protein
MAGVRTSKLLPVFLTVALVGLAAGTMALLGSAQAGKTIAVGPSGCDFTTIQAAIDAAPNGSVIQVQAGSYKENLTIRNRDGLTLQGAGPDKVTLDGNAPEQKDVTPGILILSSRNITVTGLRITNSQRGLEADDSTLLFIEANTIERNFRTGIYLLRSQAEIRGNVVRDSQALSDKPSGGTGIGVYGSRVTLAGNSITGNADAGLLVVMDGDTRSQVTGSGNTIRDNKGGDLVGNVPTALLAEPPAQGTLDQVAVPSQVATIQEAVGRVRAGGTITVSGGTYKEQVQIYKSLTIRGAGIDRTILQARGSDWLALNVATDGLTVVLEDMTVSGGYGGILIATGPASTITLQDVKAQGDVAGRNDLLRVWEESTVTLDRVSVFGSRYHGLGAWGRVKLTVANSTISNSISGGVVISERAVVTMRDTTIANNGSNGIYALDRASADIQTCTISGNVIAGIQIADSSQATVSGSQIKGAKPKGDVLGYGILATGESRVTAEKNTISQNAGFGVYLWEETVSTIRGNTISDNENFGVYMRGSASAVLEDNTITRNRAEGIRTIESSALTITRNRITSQRTDLQGGLGRGISAFGDSVLTIRDNTISGNASIGIDLYERVKATVTNNTISGNSLDGIALDWPDYPGETVNVEISSNTIQGNKGCGVRLRDNDPGLTITGHGNTISGNSKGQLCGTTSKFPKGFGGGR